MRNDSKKEFAAAYVRMSTDLQTCSIENQLIEIRRYAADRNLEIIEVFADEGKSGMRIEGRDAMERMFQSVDNRTAKYKHILVYDVSRWGRFLDPDLAAYYEVLCKRAGIRVHYCAEKFSDDGSLFATLLKNMKRAMAAEYLCELSVKVLRGQCNLIRHGFKQSGSAGYGLRRAAVDGNGNILRVLKMKEWKSMLERVILIKGPAEEVENVKKIYSMFIKGLKNETEIAIELNRRKIKTDLGREWNCGTVRQVLTNEKYIGNSVFNRTSQRIAIQDSSGKKRHIKNPPEEWVRYENAFEAIIDRKSFERVREIMAARAKKFSNDELIEKLKLLYKRKNFVSGILIDETEDMPSSAVYSHRFGSLLRAYELIGYTPDIDYSYIEINKHIRKMHPEVIQKFGEFAAEFGAKIDEGGDGDYWINSEAKLSLIICRCKAIGNRAQWHLKFERGKNPDFTIAARLNPDNITIKDFYVISRFDMLDIDLRLREQNGQFLDMFRFDDIAWFFKFFKRKPIGERSENE